MALVHITSMSAITDAAQIITLEPIDTNYKSGGGDICVGGCIVIASKGQPFTPKPIRGNTSDLQDIFGTPLPKKAIGMEGLRHVADAAEACSYVNTVRVVNIDSYRLPSLTFNVFKDLNAAWSIGQAYKSGDVVTSSGQKYICIEDHTSTAVNSPTAEDQETWSTFSGPVTTGAHAYNASLLAGDGAMFIFYPIDGDDSVNRTVRITNVDTTEKRFTITVYDKDSLGNQYVLETKTVGVDEDDKDDMGVSAFIETVFEDDKHFRIDYNTDYKWDDIVSALQAIASTTNSVKEFAFVGGTAGNVPEISDWLAAVNIFAHELVDCNFLFAAGCYEPDVIRALANVADNRSLAFFYDVPPSMSCASAIEWDKNLGLTSRHARAYYSPYKANDPWRGGSCVWGVSGAMAAAKAICNRTVSSGSIIPGVHLSPSGIKRSTLTRTGIVHLFPEDNTYNRDHLEVARINPIVPVPKGSGNCADDDLTHAPLKNYLRFGWVNDVLDYIEGRFYEMASQVKFDDDVLTEAGLREGMTTILEDMVTSDALVPPRESAYGTEPYTLEINQYEVDAWKVVWNVCITGCSRRIIGQPKLIR